MKDLDRFVAGLKVLLVEAVRPVEILLLMNILRMVEPVEGVELYGGFLRIRFVHQT